MVVINIPMNLSFVTPYNLEFHLWLWELIEVCKLQNSSRNRGFVRKHLAAIWQAKDTYDNFVQVPFQPQVATMLYNS